MTLIGIEEECAMTRNKRTIGILLAVSASFALAGCDSFEALPKNYNDDIVVNKDDTKIDVYDNIMGVLYDGISSNKKDDVLDNFIEIVAKDQFGTFKEIKALVEENDDTKIKAFLDAHKSVYYNEKKATLDDKEVTEDEYLANKYETTVDAIRKERLFNFYNSLVDKINETFYNQITGKDYNDTTGKFEEKRLAMAHYAEGYSIDINNVSLTWKEGYVTTSLKKEDVSSLISFDGRYDDYIERSIIKTVYKDKLVEQYLLDNNYSTLGRAYGRKVNIIKLTRDDKYKELPSKLLKAYASSYIDTGKDIDFETIANAWRGFRGVELDAHGDVTPIPLESEEIALLKAAGFTETYDGSGVFEETQYGQLVNNRKLALSAENKRSDYRTEDEANAWSDLTSSGTRSIEKGYNIKLADLALNDYTTDGWYVKNGGLTDLPDAIRNRLFNINVSNELDKVVEDYTYQQTDYLRKVNNHYYLTPAASEAGDDYNYIIYNESSSYIVEVVEAVSTSKLNIDGKDSYVASKKGDDVLFTETVAHKLAETLGTKDSYINNAYSSYIEEYSLVYHDSTIYDYFKEKYPELFE